MKYSIPTHNTICYKFVNLTLKLGTISLCIYVEAITEIAFATVHRLGI